MPERLSPLDASFLAVESAAAPMHVGWVARFDAPEDGRASYASLAEHLAKRLAPARRYRQKLAPVPLGLHEPEWVDDAEYDPFEHLLHARGDDLDALVDEILSTPLPRDRPLWQMWIADELPGDEWALIGKAHHCMVDGVAVAELGKLILDASPSPARSAATPRVRPLGEPSREPGPLGQRFPRSAGGRFARAALDRGTELARAPTRMLGAPAGIPRGIRTLSHTLLPLAPGSPLNRRGTARRRHVRVTRSLDDVRALRRKFGVAPNDVVLAACAGGLRRLAERHDEEPRPLKVMVPADVRGSADSDTGNRISFVFIELPCDEPDPIERLQAIHRATTRRGRDGDAEGLDSAFGLLAVAPRTVQRVMAHAFAHPRLSNLTISSVPGPAVPRYLAGSRLRTVHSAVPLAERHALSIGIVMVAGNACFGIFADAATLPDADDLGSDLDAAFDELLAAASD